MCKVVRTVVVEGSHHIVEYAVRANGSSPASEALDELKKGMWEDPDGDTFPDKRQVSDRDRLLSLVKELADGYVLRRGSYNHLQDGMWELKVGPTRFTFYDTDGHGSSCTLLPDQFDDYRGKPRYEIPEEFGPIVRLGHVFSKSGEKAKKADIKMALQVREEDLSHDAHE